MASILATFPADVREEALLNLDDGTMNALPQCQMRAPRLAAPQRCASAAFLAAARGLRPGAREEGPTRTRGLGRSRPCHPQGWRRDEYLALQRQQLGWDRLGRLPQPDPLSPASRRDSVPK